MPQMVAGVQTGPGPTAGLECESTREHLRQAWVACPWDARAVDRRRRAVGIPSCGFRGPTAIPSRCQAGAVTGCPLLFSPYPSRPRSGLYLLCGSDGLVPLMPMRVGRIRAAGGVGISNRRGPAGRCRRLRPGTSPGGGHAASRQVNRLQISTSRRLQRPAPEGFSADLQEVVSGGVGSGDEEQSLPGRLDPVPGHPHRNAAEFA